MSAEELTVKSINTAYIISGMTCESCVKMITEKISTIPEVSSVFVSLKDKKAEIVSSRRIELNEVKEALVENSKYSVSEYKPELKLSATTINIEKQSILKTYKPLITVFIFILLVSTAYQVNLGSFNSHLFMNHIMAGFFIGLSFFKFLDLKAFAESFSSYDPLAQRWLNYGYVYPFVELLLGLLFIAGKFLLLANVVTVIILTATTYGVYKRLQSKSKFECACLGTTFNLPLSNVTIGENILMITMGIYSLLS